MDMILLDNNIENLSGAEINNLIELHVKENRMGFIEELIIRI